MTLPPRSINLDALSLLVRSQRPAVLYELDARNPGLLESLRQAAAEWDFIAGFNIQELLGELDFEAGVRVLQVIDQLSQYESLSGAAYLIESRDRAAQDDRDHAQAHAEVQTGLQGPEAVDVDTAEDDLPAVGETETLGSTRERLLHLNGLLEEENARLHTQMQAASARTRTARFEEERSELREQIRALRDQNRDYHERLRRHGLLPKWEDPRQRKVETADGGTDVSVVELHKQSRWQHPKLPQQKGVVIPKNGGDSRDIMRVARRIEAYLEQCGGDAEQPLLSAALMTDGSVISSALRYLEQSGSVTRKGWDVTLVGKKKLA